MSRVSPLLSLVACLLVAAGCGGAKPVTGGTSGTLRCGPQPLGDIQLTLHQPQESGFRTIGFGLTRPDGSFDLLAQGATGPLWLTAGDYVCTLESAGAPVQFPKEYLSPKTSPLKVRWSDEMTRLDLEGPAVRLR